MQPLDTIDDKGFRHLLYTFEPRYVPPSRKTITTKYFPQLYQSLKERISALVHSATTVALTTDIWTSRANHGYTGLTIHHINKDFDLNHHLLETKEFPESHTAVNVANELTTILAEWKIEESKVAAITTDNGMNITAAVRNLGWTHLPCFSHTLQLSVEKVLKLPLVVKAIARCKRIVTHFNHSSKSSYLLKEKQSNLGHKQHSLIQDVITRWNSAYYMIKRMLEQQQPLCATLLELHKGDVWPTDTELKTLEGFVMVMEPLVEITEAIGADKWVTISTLRPILHKLLETHLLPTSDDNDLVKSMKKVMLNDLKERYTDDTLKLLTKATLLDPRFKTLKFLSQSDRRSAISDLELDFDIVNDVDMEQTQEPPPKRSKGEKKLMHFLEDMTESNDI